MDETVRVAMPAKCDVCGGGLVGFKMEERTVRVAVAPHYRTLRHRHGMVSDFRFRGTRKSYVAAEVFGHGGNFGVLVRDRYSGYDNTFRSSSAFSARPCRFGGVRAVRQRTVRLFWYN